MDYDDIVYDEGYSMKDIDENWLNRPAIISKDNFGQGIGCLVILVNAGQFHEAPSTLTSQRGSFEFSTLKIGTHI